ncbi:hypothetical protein SCLCIDRAFT_1224418 [Scleroderma citrinum Foug A]|uniref:Uncharacterized protein n=1 Tax=Scleroderma citrinum Foug A TaxID=1036808 RepID=A0A0C2ZFA3_9AGAM|nr:hypothetical protein SCLCIDRAFT_1224418 [Scleroderma citrinum Foug A]
MMRMGGTTTQTSIGINHTTTAQSHLAVQPHQHAWMHSRIVTPPPADMFFFSLTNYYYISSAYSQATTRTPQ